MPSPQVIDLTLSDDDEIQPDPIRSDQRTPTHTQATNQFRTSSSTIPTSGIDRNSGEFSQSFKVLSQPSNERKNYLPLQPFFNNTPLDKPSSTVSTTSTGLGYLTSILWRLASTQPLTTDLSQKSL